jgi:hypothetical protein
MGLKTDGLRGRNHKYDWVEAKRQWFIAPEKTLVDFFKNNSWWTEHYGVCNSYYNNGGIRNRVGGWATERKNMTMAMTNMALADRAKLESEKYAEYVARLSEVERNAMAVAVANVVSASKQVVLLDELEEIAKKYNGVVPIELIRQKARSANYDLTISEIKKLWEMARITQNKPISNTKTENIERKDTTVILKQVLQSVASELPTLDSVYDAVAKEEMLEAPEQI